MCCWADMAFPFFYFLESMLGNQSAVQESQDALTMKQLKVGMTGL